MRVVIKPVNRYEIFVLPDDKVAQRLGVFEMSEEWEGAIKFTCKEAVIIIDDSEVLPCAGAGEKRLVTEILARNKAADKLISSVTTAPLPYSTSTRK